MKALHYTTKNGRQLQVRFGYDVDGELFTNFQKAQESYYTPRPIPYTAFVSTDNPDSIDCWEPLDSGFLCHHAISAEQKDIYNRRYMKKFEDEGWTIRE